MVFVVKDPILTYFNSISTTFYGFGINLHFGTSYISRNFIKSSLPFQFARVVVDVPDPTRGALTMTLLTDMDNIFNTAPYATDGSTDSEGVVTPSSAQKFFTEFKNSKYKGVFTFVPPKSWLDVDGYLTGEDALQGYANLILSGIAFIRSFGIAADLVEIFPEPDIEKENGSVYPKDLVIIANRLRDLSISRNIVTPSVKIFGPSIGQLLPGSKDQELYTESFVFSRNALDFFSIHANENSLDENVYNSGSIDARKLVERRLRKSVTQMNAINITREKFATSFSTRATTFQKTAYHDEKSVAEEAGEAEAVANSTLFKPTVLGDSQEFSIRVLENLVGIMSLGFNSAFYESLVARTDENDAAISADEDSRSLYSIDGSSREVTKMWEKLYSVLPLPGNIFRSEEINAEEDFTVKTLLMSTNGSRFCFILSRPVQPDTLVGRLRLTVNNPLWSTNYEVTNLAITSYPPPAPFTIKEITDEYGKKTTQKTVGAGVDLSEVVMKATMNLNYMSLFTRGLPYGGCVLFITGSVALKEPPVPVPAPAPAPTPTPGGSGGSGNDDETPSDSSPVLMQT